MSRGVIAGALLCGVAGGVAGGALFTTLQPRPASLPAPAPAAKRDDPGQRALDTGVSVVVAQLARDVDKLVLDVEALQGPAARQDGASGLVAGAAPESILRRLEALEATLRAIHPVGGSGAHDPESVSPATLRQGLERLGIPGGGMDWLAGLACSPEGRDPADPERVAIILRLLASEPAAEDAPAYLSELIGIHLRWGRFADARAALEDWGPRVGAPEPVMRRARAEFARRVDDDALLVDSVRALLDTRSLEVADRANLRRELATTLLRLERFAEARADLQRLVADAEADPSITPFRFGLEVPPEHQASWQRNWIDVLRVDVARALIGEGRANEARTVLQEIVGRYDRLKSSTDASRAAGELLASLDARATGR